MSSPRAYQPVVKLWHRRQSRWLLASERRFKPRTWPFTTGCCVPLPSGKAKINTSTVEAQPTLKPAVRILSRAARQRRTARRSSLCSLRPQDRRRDGRGRDSVLAWNAVSTVGALGMVNSPSYEARRLIRERLARARTRIQSQASVFPGHDEHDRPGVSGVGAGHELQPAVLDRRPARGDSHHLPFLTRVPAHLGLPLLMSDDLTRG